MRLSCREIRLRSSEYLDGDLAGPAAAAVRRHLAACAGCAAFANTLRRTLDLSRQLPPVAVPAEIRRQVQEMVWTRKGSGRTRTPRRGR